MSSSVSVVERERAELLAQRAAVIAILRVLGGTNPNAILRLKLDNDSGAQVMPLVSPTPQQPLLVSDQLLRDSLRAILTEAGL